MDSLQWPQEPSHQSIRKRTIEPSRRARCSHQSHPRPPDIRPIRNPLRLKICNWGTHTASRTLGDIGWIAIQNAALFKKATLILRWWTATTHFQWVKGYDGDHGNEESDRLAKEGAGKAIPDELNLQIPIEFDVQGTKLSTMTQALAYRGIQQKKTESSPPTTPILLQQIQDTILDFNGQCKTNMTIWKSFRKPILRTWVQQFLYKATHQALIVGNIWNHILNFEHRETCLICNTMESMKHILTQCDANANWTIWHLAKETWPHNNSPWPEINISIVMGVGCPNPPNRDNDNQNGRNPHTMATQKANTCLLQILILESAHLIWVLRCKRIIQEKTHTNCNRLSGVIIGWTNISSGTGHCWDLLHPWAYLVGTRLCCTYILPYMTCVNWLCVPPVRLTPIPDISAISILSCFRSIDASWLTFLFELPFTWSCHSSSSPASPPIRVCVSQIGSYY